MWWLYLKGQSVMCAKCVFLVVLSQYQHHHALAMSVLPTFEAILLTAISANGIIQIAWFLKAENESKQVPGQPLSVPNKSQTMLFMMVWQFESTVHPKKAASFPSIPHNPNSPKLPQTTANRYRKYHCIMNFNRPSFSQKPACEPAEVYNCHTD